MKLIAFLVTFVVGVFANAVMALLGGWSLMLAVGVAHAEWIRALPTIGYWWAVLIVFLLQGALKTVDLGKD